VRRNSGELTEAYPVHFGLECVMVMAAPLSLYSSRPPSFRHFVHDALVLLGLPYGPQARERLAQAHPDLFGRSSSTLRGYERWLAHSGTSDTLEAFAHFMDRRYRRWIGLGA
jgi:hypothetical protein